MTRSVPLDPASSTSDPGPAADTAAAPVSAADANRLIGRMVLRQLYGYGPNDPVNPAASAGANDPAAAGSTAGGASGQAAGPLPDLAKAAPKLSNDGLTATITLRTARWDVSSRRRVTVNDQVRALKRLCLPSVRSPISGYFAESVVGYAAACRSLAAHPPATVAALDAVTVAGLATEGDTTLVVHLIRRTDDLAALLALPQTSPLPVESFTGLSVTNDPLGFVGDGPYHFVEPQSGETYALSRSGAWDTAEDPLRHAYVDHISIRSGMTAQRVRQLVGDGGADMALDVPATPALAASLPASQLVKTLQQSAATLAVGSSGAAASSLAVPGVRRLIAACIDTGTRRRVAAALGGPIASPASDLLIGLPAATGGPSPSPSAGASSSASASSSSGSPPASPATATASPSASASPSIPAVRCAPTAAIAGLRLSLLVADAAPLRAAADVIARRLAVAGLVVSVDPVRSADVAASSRFGGWDLLLSIRTVRYPGPRALLAPLLDDGWLGSDAIAMLRSPVGYQLLRAALRARSTSASREAWDTLRAFLNSSATLLPLATLDAVYQRGRNVAYAPSVPTFGNADPTNASLGSTRTGEPARSPTPTP